MADAADTTETADAPGDDVVEVETDEARQGVLDVLTDALGDAVVGSHIDPGKGLWVRVAREAWTDAAEAAKARLGFTFFDHLSAIDWMPSPWGRYEDSAVDDGVIPFDPTAPIETGVAGGDTRFQVMCRLANVRRHTEAHLNVVFKADLPDDDLRVDSLVPLYAGANWHERECWEMFGITFDGHPSLRHLYLPGEFEGHPLRKDFPLLARLVKPWPGIVDVEPMPEEPAAPDASKDDAANGDAGAGAGTDATEKGDA